MNLSLSTLQHCLRSSFVGIAHDNNTNDSNSSSSETDCEPEDNKGEGGGDNNFKMLNDKGIHADMLTDDKVKTLLGELIKLQSMQKGEAVNTMEW